MSDKLYMVFDVESVGLHGEGFAVGFVVANHFGVEIQSASIGCNSSEAVGTPEDRKWILENLPVFAPTIEKASPKEVREEFWRQWLVWKSRGAMLFADCAWPVEARFLNACVIDSLESRKWDGPYPLHDIATVLLASGKDPLEKFPRKANEIPPHDPLCDARQSARILVENLHPK